MKMSKKEIFNMTLFVVLVFNVIFIPSTLMAWEKPITIASKAGYGHDKPEIGFDPTGIVYIAYREKNLASNSDIMVCSYDGKKKVYHNVSEGAKSWSRYKAYESDLVVTDDSRVHVAWVSLNKDASETHYVKYRYLDGDKWSKIITLGTLRLNGDFLFDFRLAVDGSGNVHVTYMEDHHVVVKYIVKYGNYISAPIEVGNSGSRKKHPDIAVDDDYVHFIWMRLEGNYRMMYRRLENKKNGNWGAIKQITFPQAEYGSQKSRIDVGSDGLVHMAEFSKKGIVKRLKYHKQKSPNTWPTDSGLTVSSSVRSLYHWADIEVKDNSIIATMQLGSGSSGGSLHYNWQKDGKWGGYKAIPDVSKALHQSVDLSPDGKVAAVAYVTSTDKVYLVATDKIVATGQLEANFSYPENMFTSSDITFDASECTSLNPDYTIGNYIWDFNGIVKTTTEQTINHTFDVVRKNIKVSLKIETENGDETGVVEKDIYINANYNASNVEKTSMNIKTLIYNRSAYKITWSANTENSDAGIVKYQIWRSLVTGTMPSTDPNDYKQITEVSSSTFIYYDYTDVENASNYEYIVRTVDASGNVSPLLNN